jgi:hypothetical protein
MLDKKPQSQQQHKWKGIGHLLYPLGNIVRRIGRMLRSQNVLFIGFGTFLAIGANLPFYAITMKPDWTLYDIAEFTGLGWAVILPFLLLILRWLRENDEKTPAEKNNPMETMRTGLAQLVSDQQLINTINQATRGRDEKLDRLITAIEHLVQKMEDGKID